MAAAANIPKADSRSGVTSAGRQVEAAASIGTPQPARDAATAGLTQPVPSPKAAEEEEIQARCHPHLLTDPPQVPQVDVRQSREPRVDHIKIHFWVDGAGLVTAAEVTTANVGTAAEQQAELAYTRALTFTVPDTPQCKVRQIELVGNFEEGRAPNGNWYTYARLYPRFTLASDGVVHQSE
jgi:hypothetical protein